jgi:hypothetical protein
MRIFDGRMAFVPEGQADRSLARSAWDNATPKSRPVGYGVIRASSLAILEAAKRHSWRLSLPDAPCERVRWRLGFLQGVLAC